MKVLNTGVTGFLGEHTGRACHKRGYSVVGLIRDKKIIQEHFNFPLEIRNGDLSLLVVQVQ